MGFIKDLINNVKIPGDGVDDDMDIDDGYDDSLEEEREYRRPPLRFSQGRRNQEREEDDEYQETPRRQQRPQSRPQTSAAAASRPAGGAKPDSGMQVRIIKPSSFDQARQITDTLLAHRTVLLNLEGLDVNTAQRIVDFASGSCYALNGNFSKISHYIIVITPEEVDIAGDMADMETIGGIAGLSGAGGVGSMGANPFVEQPFQQNAN